DPGAVESGYHQISRKLVGRPGLRGNELLRSMDDPRRYTVLSDWASREEYIAWRDAPEHLAITAPLRPYWAADRDSTFGVYEVVAAYSPARRSAGRRSGAARARAGRGLAPGVRAGPYRQGGTDMPYAAITFRVKPGHEEEIRRIFAESPR